MSRLGASHASGRRWRRTVRLSVVALVAAAALVVATSSTSLTSPLGGGAGHAAKAIAAASASCPSDGDNGCVESLPCATNPCPTVDAQPVTDLSDGQYVFIKATDFPTGTAVRVALCSTSPTVSTDPTDPECLNGTWETHDWTPVPVPIAQTVSGDNLTQVAVPAFFDESGQGDDPLPDHDILNNLGPGSGFFCDNTTDPCAYEVTEETSLNVGVGPPDSSANTLYFPLTFAGAGAGCPDSDPQIQTEGSYSIEHFIPAAVEATCNSGNGVVAVDTVNDNQSVVSDFAKGSTPLAFIDDPSDPVVQSALGGKALYAYIPVAVSATVVGFLAAQVSDSYPYPLSTYNLTPNMLAGIVTSDYESAVSSPESVDGREIPGYSDNLFPGLDCNNIVGCPTKNPENEVYNELNYTTFNLLNPVSPGVQPPGQLGAFMSNVSSGASYEATNWICDAPNTPLNVQVNEIHPPTGQTNPVTVTVTDRNVAATTLTTAPTSDIWPPYTSPTQPDGPPWVFPTCGGYSDFPPLASNLNYASAQNPSFQAKNIRQFAYGGDPVPIQQNGVNAGFGLMDSSEAAFYGLNQASLENTNQTFVAPTEQNIEAAVETETACGEQVVSCPPGTYSLDYSSQASPDSYPLPDITYALVSTAPQPAQTANEIKNLLTNLVTYSHASSSVLPQGYAPLPDSLYQAAIADIAQDVVAAPATQPATSSGSSGTSPAPATGSSDSGTSDDLGSGSSDDGSSDLGSSLPLSSTSTASPTSTTSPKTPRSSSGQAPAQESTKPSGFVLVSVDQASRLLLPILIALAGACLVLGPLMLLLPAVRRRRSMGTSSMNGARGGES